MRQISLDNDKNHPMKVILFLVTETNLWPTAVLKCRPPRCFYYSEDIYLQISSYCFRSAQTHPSPTFPSYIPYRRKEPTYPTSNPLLFSNSSNQTPGLTNCKWVSNSPKGKGSYIVSSTYSLWTQFQKNPSPPCIYWSLTNGPIDLDWNHEYS